jgi:hypothetical protein
MVIVATVVLALLIGAAIVGRGLDAAVLTEAGKSLGYRLEYWQSTLSMIRNHFWFGVGPGNFQDFYTQYKLPQASEEIRDPHNMFFEVWATCGTLAVVAFSVGLVGTLWRAWTAERREDQATSESARTTDCKRSQVVMLVGAVAGFVTAFLMGPLVGVVLSEEQLLAGLVLSGIVVAIVWPWIRQGNLTSRLAALGLVALSVHLLAAGGIAFPSVAYSFWLLAAITLNVAEPPLDASTELAPVEARRLRVVAVSIAIVAAGGAIACYVFACRPMVTARSAMARAEELALSNAQSPAVRVLWLEAAAADPWLSEPWAALAELELRRVRRNPNDSAARQRFTNAADELLENRKHSSTVMRQVGQWYDELDEIEHDPETVRVATSYLRRATALYPNSATIRGEYALILNKNERTSEVRRQAKIALDLDAATPHADKKLPAELKAKLESLLSGNVAPAAAER